jgi:hypothetical protein
MSVPTPGPGFVPPKDPLFNERAWWALLAALSLGALAEAITHDPNRAVDVFLLTAACLKPHP